MEYTPVVDTVIYRAGDRDLAQQVIRLLRHQGIRAQALPAESGGQAMYRIPICVPAEQVAAAGKLLAEFDRRRSANVKPLTASFRRDLVTAGLITLVLLGGFVLLGWRVTGSGIQNLAVAPVLLVFVLMAQSMLRDKRRRRHREAATPRCENCGYSLEHLTVPRCPECGEHFDSKILRQARADRDDAPE